MREPTVFLIRSPWSGDEYDPVPWSYPVWFWLYKNTRRLRHRLGLHDWNGHLRVRCTWCGKVRMGSKAGEA